MTTQLELLRDRRFLPMLLTQMTSGFNDNLFKSGFVMLVTFGGADTGGLPPAALAALAGGLLILPFPLFSATAGQLADRSERARLLRLLKAAEILIVLCSGAAILSGSLWLSLLVLFLLGTQATLSSPIKYALLPQHLAESELLDGNALMEAGTFLGILAGTIAGGLVTSLPHGRPAAALALVACALAGFAASLFVPPAPAPLPDLRLDRDPVAATRRVMREALARPEIRAAIHGGSWFWLMGSVYLSQFPSWARDRLGADGSVVTLFFAAFSIGVGVGSSLCGRLLRGEITARFVPWAGIAMALFSAELYAATPARPPAGPLLDLAGFLATGTGWRLLLSLVGIALAGGLFVVPLYTIMQDRAEATMRARVIAACNIVNALYMAGAAIVVAILLQRGLPVPAVFLLLAGGHAAAALAVRRSLPGRRPVAALTGGTETRSAAPPRS